MVEVSQIKVGAFFWWEADRPRKYWSCPCVVTEAEQDSFKVVSLDDFKEIGPLRMHDGGDESCRSEMRPCTLQEVERYIEDRKRRLGDDITSAKRALQDRQQELREYKENAKALLAKATS